MAPAPIDFESWVTPEGEEVYVDFGEATQGSKEPFYPAYRAPDREQRYGWFCSNCESVDNTMDPMGTIECNRCANRRQPTRWDAAYL